MKGYRTIIFNALTTLASLGVVFGFEIPPEMIDEAATGIVAVFSIGNVIMRAVTTTPIGQKD